MLESLTLIWHFPITCIYFKSFLNYLFCTRNKTFSTVHKTNRLSKNNIDLIQHVDGLFPQGVKQKLSRDYSLHQLKTLHSNYRVLWYVLFKIKSTMRKCVIIHKKISCYHKNRFWSNYFYTNIFHHLFGDLVIGWVYCRQDLQQRKSTVIWTNKVKCCSLSKYQKQLPIKTPLTIIDSHHSYWQLAKGGAI